MFTEDSREHPVSLTPTRSEPRRDPDVGRQGPRGTPFLGESAMGLGPRVDVPLLCVRPPFRSRRSFGPTPGVRARRETRTVRVSLPRLSTGPGRRLWVPHVPTPQYSGSRTRWSHPGCPVPCAVTVVVDQPSHRLCPPGARRGVPAKTVCGSGRTSSGVRHNDRTVLWTRDRP